MCFNLVCMENCSDEKNWNFLFTFVISVYILLLKTELRTSDFKHFHWLAGHRLSVHIHTVPNMVKEHVSNKASRKHFCSSEKKWPTKDNLTGIDRGR